MSDRRQELRRDAERLFGESLVWDMTLPWNPVCNMADVDIILPEYRRLGFKPDARDVLRQNAMA